MSYILDALRRAQAERERGQVPGLEARTPVHTPPPPRHGAALGWLAGGALALALLGLALSIGLPRGAPPTAVAPVAAQTPTPTAGPATPAPAPAAPSTAQTAMVVVSAPAVPAARQGSATQPPVSAPVSTPVTAPAAVPAPAPAPVSGPAPTSTNARAVRLAQLSADLRRELPALTVSGAIWSDNAASRFVIVNGQVLREGEAAAPGVLLERIGPKAVFLRWRDWLIEVPV